MASARVIQVEGDEGVALELTAIGIRGGNVRPVWPAIFALMEEFTEEQFDSRGLRGGNFWEDLSQGWLWHKFQSGQNLAIMRASDETYSQLTGGGSGVREEGDDWVMFGADTPQFAMNQDYNPSSNYPERTPVVFTEADAVVFADVINSYVVGTADRLGVVRRRYPKGTPGGLGGRFVSE